MIREIVTIVCITTITAAVVYFNPDFSKDVVLTTLGGLIGYLSREAVAAKE